MRLPHLLLAIGGGALMTLAAHGGVAATTATETAAATTSAGATAPANDSERALASLADDYFDRFWFPTYPTAATQAGIHRYDSRLEDYRRAALEHQMSELRRYQRRFEAIDAAALPERAAGDRELLLSNVRSTLLTLQTIRPWEKNPDSYPSSMAQSALSLIERKFAPPAERLRALIAREQRMPGTLAAARANLRNPPEIYTRIALEQLPGTISFFATDVPAAFSDVNDPALTARLQSVTGDLVAALKHYQDWLQQQLLPQSHGDFRIGSDTFRTKLLYDEMVDTPLPRLLEIGRADLERNQREFQRVAHELDPNRSAAEVREQLELSHPPPDALLGQFRSTFDRLIEFIQSHHIISLPSDTRPILKETPPFLRATTFASMDTPGPFESVAKEAYFFVTLPNPSWTPEHTADFMRQYSPPQINNIAVHETYPGHYVQFLWMHRIEGRVRKLLGANSNAEGWAHYCEQMMLDEGFGRSAPAEDAEQQRQVQLLRLAQLQDALLRDARFIVGIQLHTGQMTLEQARDFFTQQGYQPRSVGETETKRGTQDPTYLYYTLGKLQILKLRADLAAREGAAFNLEQFHDAFMQQGFPPIRLVRRALLHDDSPTL